MKRNSLFFLAIFFSLAIFAQNITVSGVITDNQKYPVIGATVVVLGGDELHGTSTDSEGRFTLTNVPHQATLRITYIGMMTHEVAVNGRSKIDVELIEDSEQLDELVVIGYGSMQKKDLTGAVGLVRTRDLTLAPVASFEGALAGRVAGVQVSFSDGQPGDPSNIVIRGASSLTQSNAPLYVIDGVAIEDPDNSALNSEEIESMTILKDASATAIYGSRAANGVIIIETKKGVTAKPVISLNISTGFQQPIKYMEMMNPYDFVRLQLEMNEIRTQQIYTKADLPESDPYYDPDGRTLEDYRNVKGTNWQDLLLNTEPVQDYNLSIRGKSGGTSYSISGSYFDQVGIIKSSGFKRYQGRINLNQEISSKVTMGFNVQYSKSIKQGATIRDNDGDSGGYRNYLLTRAWSYRPVSGSSDVDLEDLIGDPDITDLAHIRVNPLISSQNDYNMSPRTTFSSRGNLNYSITKELTLRSLISFYEYQYANYRFYNSRTTQAAPINKHNTRGIHGNYYEGTNQRISNENTLTYRKTFKRRHRVTAVVGHSFSKTDSERFGYSSQHIPNEELGMYGMNEGLAYSPISDGSDNALLSYFGRVDYNYRSMVMFTASFRADGSTKFVKDNRWGYFPSTALAWSIKESLLKDKRAISEAKLRFSYGLTGNNRVGNYDYLGTASLSPDYSYPFHDQDPMHGVVPTSLANESLKWETTKQSNLGLDLGFFDERLVLNVDVYKKLTEDLLLNAELPTSTGHSYAMRNIGSMSNSGLEISLQTINISRPKFSWTSNFNISFNKNEILELTRNQNKILTNISVVGYTSPLYISRIGYPAGMFFGYVFDGIHQVEDFDNPAEGVYVLKNHLPDNGTNRSTIQPGDIKYKDLNNDGTINAQDMTIIGRGQPIHYGGVTNTFYYNGFSLSVFFQWSYGNQIYNANRMRFEGSPGMYMSNSYASFNDRWTPENRSNLLYTAHGYGAPGYQSNRVLEDGSYLRLKTLSLGYELPRNISEYFHLENITIRVSSQNLFTWTKYSGMDPEVSTKNDILSPGYDYSAYPQSRTLLFGINITL